MATRTILETLRAVLVEFVGVPGSGKTTLAEALAAEFQRRGLTVVQANNAWRHPWRWTTRIHRLRLAVECAVASPASARSAIRLVQASKQRSLSDAASVVTNWLCKLRLMRRRGAADIGVTDEGTLHAIWSLAYSATARDAIAALAAHHLVTLAPSAWIVVRVATEEQVASRWLLSREGPRNRLAADITTAGSAAIRDAAAAGCVVDELVASLAACGAIRAVLDVVNEPGTSPEETVWSLAARVLSIRGQSVHGP